MVKIVNPPPIGYHFRVHNKCNACSEKWTEIYYPSSVYAEDPPARQGTCPRCGSSDIETPRYERLDGNPQGGGSLLAWAAISGVIVAPPISWDQEQREREARASKRKKAIELLNHWMSTPDDVGEERWAEFDRVLAAYPLSF